MHSLYVTDLDGTLLQSNGTLSEKTIQILSTLLNNHVPITFATARTPLGISPILSKLPCSLPMILLNGGVIWDPITQSIVDSNPFFEYQKEEILSFEQKYDLSGFYISEKGHTCQYHLNKITPEWTTYYKSHFLPFPDVSPVNSDPLLYASFCDSKADRLQRIYEELKQDSNYYLDFYKDKYLPEMWFLEIYFAHATKGTALQKLRSELSPIAITAFGDSSNDFSLFEAADSCCAVANAMESLKEQADQILSSNDEDAVANYLWQHYETDALLEQAIGKRSIVTVPNTILQHLQQIAPNPTHSLSRLDTFDEHRNFVYFLFDGFGSNLLEKHLPANSFLREHATMKLSSVFPSTTTAAATALETGLFPSQSGYLGWSVYWPSLGNNVQLYPNLTDDGKPAASIHLAKEQLYRPFLTDIIQKNSEIQTSFLTYSGDSLKQLEEEIETISNENGKHFIYAYINNPDHLLHRHGVSSNLVTAFLCNVNTTMKCLASRCPDTQFLLTADHGIIDVEPLCLEDFPELLELLVRPPSIEPRALNFFVKEGMEQSLIKRFHQITKNTYRLFSKKEVLERQLFGYPPHHPFFADMLGDFLAVAQTPLTLFPNRSYLSSMVATHGGVTPEEMLVPLIVWDSI